jgi:hypothetical protein
MTKDERLHLKMNTSTSVRWEIFRSLLMGFFVFSCLVYFVLNSLWKWLFPMLHSGEQKFSLLFVAPLVSVVFFFFLLRKDLKTLTLRKKDPVKDDLDAGVTHVQKYNVLRAVEIVEREDEGAGFFLELKDGRVLCIIGQDLYDYATEENTEEGQPHRLHKFPQTQIEYRFAPKSKTRLSISGIGQTLRPYGWVVYKNGRGQFGPEDGFFYEGPLEAVLKKFNFKLEKFS